MGKTAKTDMRKSSPTSYFYGISLAHNILGMTSQHSVVRGKTRVELLRGTWKGKDKQSESREGTFNRAEKGIKTCKSNSNLPL